MLNKLKSNAGLGVIAGAAICTTAIFLVVSSSAQSQAPAISDASPQVENGRDIFMTAGGVGCAACHGIFGEGDVGIGPYARGVNRASIDAALESIAEMSFLRSSVRGQSIDDIAAYTEWLGNHQLVKTLAKRGRFIPDSVSVRPNTLIQLVISNASRFPRTFASDDMGIGEISVDGREVAEIIWTSPSEEGTFTLRCLDCRITDQQLSIQISNDAAPFTPVSGPPVEVANTPAPAVQTAADLDLIDRGRDIFLNAGEVGCTACHGSYAEGDVGIGPYNRGLDEDDIRLALANVDAMRFLQQQLDDEQIHQVAAYYGWLGDHQLFKTRMIRGQFFPNRIRVAPGAAIQLAITNRARSPGAFFSADMGIEPFVVQGLETVDFFWTAPRVEAEFTLRCADCATSDWLTIETTQAAR